MRRNKTPPDYIPQMDRAGKITYVYNGPVYELEWTAEQRKWFCILALLIPIAALIIFILMGFINADCTKQVYVIVPFVSLFFPLVFLLIAAMRVYFVGRTLWRQDYQRTFASMRRCTLAVQCLAGMLLIVLILFSLFQNTTTTEPDRTFTIDTAILFLLLTFFHWLQSHVRCVRAR